MNAKTLRHFAEEYNREQTPKEQMRPIYNKMLNDLSLQAKKGNFYSLWFPSQDIKNLDKVLLIKLLREDGFKVIKICENQYRIEW